MIKRQLSLQWFQCYFSNNIHVDGLIEIYVSDSDPLTHPPGQQCLTFTQVANNRTRFGLNIFFENQMDRKQLLTTY